MAKHLAIVAFALPHTLYVDSRFPDVVPDLALRLPPGVLNRSGHKGCKQTHLNQDSEDAPKKGGNINTVRISRCASRPL